MSTFTVSDDWAGLTGQSTLSRATMLASWRAESGAVQHTGVVPLFDFSGQDYAAADETAVTGVNWQAWWAETRMTPPRVLEVGSFEGRSAHVWASQLNPPALSVLTVDIGPYGDFSNSGGRAILLEKNVSEHQNVVLKYGMSARVLNDINLAVANKELLPFDFIYIDGSHQVDDKFLDAELAWRVLVHGGVMVFDDYSYPYSPNDNEDAVAVLGGRRAIHCFLMLHGGEFQILEHVVPTTQLALVKTAPRLNLWGTLTDPVGVQIVTDSANQVRHPPFRLPVWEGRSRTYAVQWLMSPRFQADIIYYGVEPWKNFGHFVATSGVIAGQHLSQPLAGSADAIARNAEHAALVGDVVALVANQALHHVVGGASHALNGAIHTVAAWARWI